MNIAVDSNVFTLQTHGGVSRYLVRLAEECMTLGHQVRVFGWLHKNHHLAEASRELTRMRHIHGFPRLTRRVSHTLGDLLAGPAIARWGPDVIHESFCHSRRVGGRATPRVCTIHDMIHELFPQYWGRLDRTPRYRRDTIARCHAVICVSESTKRDLLRFIDVDPARIHVIHHGYEHTSAPAEPAPHELAALAALTSKPCLLYVGARHGYKNFDGFLRGFAAAGVATDLRVIAFGGGPLKPAELDLARDLGLPAGSVVQASGSDAMLRRLYRHARLFAYPSLYEGFGFPPLEAMAEDCPVISSHTSSMPEIIGDAAVFFDPSDPQAIADAIRSVAGNDTVRTDLAARGRRRLKAFSWRRCALETLAAYEAAIAHARS